MIHVFFVPGMFGSTIEYVLRSYTHELDPIVGATLCDDGSMHSFKKQAHPQSVKHIDDLFNSTTPVQISTPIYPFRSGHFLDALDAYKKYFNSTDKNILVYAPDLRSAELNILFQYHKIAFGSNLQLGLDIFCYENTHNIKNWNPAYTHWSQMQPWELREWFSLFYHPWVQEWIDSYDQAPGTFLKIKNTELLFDTKETLLSIIDFCELTVQNSIDSFIAEWQQNQHYILKEFELLDQIISSVVEKKQHQWANLNIIAESIIQQRLRSLGYEIQCDGLNIFPTDSISLYNLLEKC
jgi:hypothetical protein